MDETTRKYLEVVKRRFAFHQETIENKGANSMVFNYWICEPDEFGLIGMKMTFYHGADVYVAFVKENMKLPYSLATELINSGSKVSVEFPDGKPPVVFNEGSTNKKI